MDLSDQIVNALRARNSAGDTFEHMANVSGVSHSYIHQIANRRSSPLKMSLEKFLALFPRAQIQLDASARVSADSAACGVSLEQYQDLREQYQNLREQYQDLRDRYFELKSRPPLVLDGEGPAPYHAPILSGSNKQ